MASPPASSSSTIDFLTRVGLQNDDNVDVDGILRNASCENQENTLLDAEMSLLDGGGDGGFSVVRIREEEVVPARKKTVDDVWREIVEGKRQKREMMVAGCKAEVVDEMMTLEDFLVRAGAVDEVVSDGGGAAKVKIEEGTEGLSGRVFAFDSPAVQFPLKSGGGSGDYMGSGLGTARSVDSVGSFWNVMQGMGGERAWVGKRRTVSALEPMDKAAQQRQKRMIKNRESAARSRERKQEYQVELEARAVRLQEEKERLLKEMEGRTKARLTQLMEKVIPVVEKRRPPRALRRVRSIEW